MSSRIAASEWPGGLHEAACPSNRVGPFWYPISNSLTLAVSRQNHCVVTMLIGPGLSLWSHLLLPRPH